MILPGDKESVLRQKWRKHKRLLILIVAVMLLAGGAYLLVLTLSPKFSYVPSSIDLNTDDDVEDMRDRIQISKLNLEVPYFAGGAEELNKGAWWRYPERGNPERGGNFILSAHRFELGLTPEGTKARSPFYTLNKLELGDEIRVFYQGKWYDYIVTKNYSVPRTAIEIEAPSDSARLTLYTCSLKGEIDGRVVVEAQPK